MNAQEALALLARFERRWDDQASVAGWAGVLAGFPLFAGVRKRRLRELVRHATFCEFAPGETIILSGDADDSLHIVLAGHARTALRADRRVLGVGDYFGEVAMIDGGARSATVVALSYVHVMKLPSSSVRKLAQEHPPMTFTMLRQLTTRFRRLEAENRRRAAATG